MAAATHCGATGMGRSSGPRDGCQSASAGAGCIATVGGGCHFLTHLSRWLQLFDCQQGTRLTPIQTRSKASSPMYRLRFSAEQRLRGVPFLDSPFPVVSSHLGRDAQYGTATAMPKELPTNLKLEHAGGSNKKG